MESKTLSIEETFNYTPEKVWLFWQESEKLKTWWAPEGMYLEIVDHEFNENGIWTYSMPMPNGSHFVSEGKYISISPCKKIITSANFKPVTTGIELHINFEKIQEQTKLTVKAVHPTEAYCQQQKDLGFHAGWKAAFTRLESALAKAG